MTPATALPGDILTVTGRGFGPVDAGRVLVGGVAAAVVGWTDTRIAVVVPSLGAGAAAVTVSAGGVSSAPAAITVGTPPPQQPIANALVLPLKGTQIYYDSTLALDPDAGALRAGGAAREAALGPGIRSVLWRFGDGQEATSERGYHTYARPGVYPVTLRVTPTSGAPVVVRQRVAVGLGRPRPPLNIAIPSQLVFDFGRAELRPASARYLLRIARVIRKARSVTVGGYTDSAGPRAFNRALSLRRARAVRAFLVRRGRVPASVLLPRGYGETARFGDNRTDLGKQRNRRVVLFVRFPQRLARI